MMSDADGLGVFNLCFYSSTRPCVCELIDFETAACASMTAVHVHIYIQSRVRFRRRCPVQLLPRHPTSKISPFPSSLSDMCDSDKLTAY